MFVHSWCCHIADIRTHYALKYPLALFVHPSSHHSIFMTSVV